MKPKLTDKQKRFCHEYMVDMNGTQAAIRAGYSKKTADVIASENLVKPKITEYLGTLKGKQEQRTEITADSILKRINELAEICLGHKPLPFDKKKFILDASGANKALENLGKTKALFIDKIQTMEKPFYTDEEIDQMMKDEKE